MMYIPLEKEFYKKKTLDLATALLGCVLVSKINGHLTSGYIVETEAYIGPTDQAAHSYKNKRTKRTNIMFGEAGRAYTYVMHTHCLFNVVSGEIDNPEAILIRAIEPIDGVDIMKSRRKTNDLSNLTNGPGKLAKSLGITMDYYGHDITIAPLYIAEGFKPGEIKIGKRIGIKNAGKAIDYPWRFWIGNNQFVSAHKKEFK